MLAAKLLRAKPSLMLLQNANDLFFAETASLHRLSPQLENRLTSNRGVFRGAGHQLPATQPRRFDSGTHPRKRTHRPASAAQAPRPPTEKQERIRQSLTPADYRTRRSGEIYFGAFGESSLGVDTLCSSRRSGAAKPGPSHGRRPPKLFRDGLPYAPFKFLRRLPDPHVGMPAHPARLRGELYADAAIPLSQTCPDPDCFRDAPIGRRERFHRVASLTAQST